MKNLEEDMEIASVSRSLESNSDTDVTVIISLCKASADQSATYLRLRINSSNVDWCYPKSSRAVTRYDIFSDLYYFLGTIGGTIRGKIRDASWRGLSLCRAFPKFEGMTLDHTGGLQLWLRRQRQQLLSEILDSQKLEETKETRFSRWIDQCPSNLHLGRIFAERTLHAGTEEEVVVRLYSPSQLDIDEYCTLVEIKGFEYHIVRHVTTCDGMDGLYAGLNCITTSLEQLGRTLMFGGSSWGPHFPYIETTQYGEEIQLTLRYYSQFEEHRIMDNVKCDTSIREAAKSAKDEMLRTGITHVNS